MNVKINDNVLVIAGKDKGKQGKVLATSPKANTVVVEGVRIQKKHEKARKANETSKIVETPGPVDASNVAVVCGACGKATKVKHNVVDGKKVRVCAKCGAVLDKAYSKKAAKGGGCCGGGERGSQEAHEKARAEGCRNSRDDGKQVTR